MRKVVKPDQGAAMRNIAVHTLRHRPQGPNVGRLNQIWLVATELERLAARSDLTVTSCLLGQAAQEVQRALSKAEAGGAPVRLFP